MSAACCHPISPSFSLHIFPWYFALCHYISSFSQSSPQPYIFCFRFVFILFLAPFLSTCSGYFSSLSSALSSKLRLLMHLFLILFICRCQTTLNYIVRKHLISSTSAHIPSIVFNYLPSQLVQMSPHTSSFLRPCSPYSIIWRSPKLLSVVCSQRFLSSTPKLLHIVNLLTFLCVPSH